ncbi:MAG: tetratricopeptide repeat protein [bacterium]|nr:tetratricopeptide repeat protein [bacterium]
MQATLFKLLGVLMILLGMNGMVYGQKSDWKQDSTYLNAHLFDQPDSALMLCKKWLQKSTEGSKRYAALLSRKAVIDDVQGRPGDAVKGFLKAIDIQAKKKDSTELSFSYNNLGICQFYMYRYDEAIENYRNSARIDSLMNDLRGWAGTMLNIAIIYSNQGKTDDALYIYNDMIGVMHEVKDYSLDASIYSNRAKLLVLQKNYKSALINVEKARPAVLESNDPSPKMTLEVIASNAHLGLLRFDEALSAARRGVGYDTGNNYPERRSHLYECMSHAFYAKAMIDSANYYNDLYQEIRDSLFTSETQEQLSEIQTKYGLAKRNEELAESQLKQVKYKNRSIRSARKASESREQRNLFMAVAAILVVIGLLLWIVLQRRRSEQALLQEKLHSKEQLVEQKEAFLGEIHHRVRNNLQMVSSMLAMQERTLNDQQMTSILESSRSRIETMSLIHERLYKNSSGRSVDLNEYVQQLSNQIVGAYSNKEIKMEYKIDALQLHIDSMVPLALILNELITNSLKYAFEDGKGTIGVALSVVEKRLILDYWDSGKGFSEVPSGFGSRLMQSLSRQLKAEREQGMGSDGFHQKFYISQYKTSEE